MMKNKKFLPSILTTLPGPKTKEWVDRYTKSFGGRPPRISVDKAYNCIYEDPDGNQFLVFAQASTIAGFSNPFIIKAANNQIVKNIPRTTAAPVLIEFNEKLLRYLPGKLQDGRVNYSASGTEAVELAVYLARSYTGKSIILSYHDSHHGYIGTPYQLSGDPNIKKTGAGRITDIIHVPYPKCYRCPFKQEYPDCGILCLDYLNNVIETAALPEQIAGILFEPILVNGGMYLPPSEYMKGLVELCHNNSILLIMDEVYTGIGKSGRFLAIDHWKLTPDILCLGKALGGGFPLATVVTSKEITDVTRGGTRFTGTFTANLVACSAGIATLDILDKSNLSEKAEKIGNYLMKELRSLAENKKHIGDVRGKGLLIGIDIVEEKETKKPSSTIAKEILEKAFHNGLIMRLVGRYRNVFAVTPSLILEKYQVDEAIIILDKIIE
ncbi:aspartate aminotransferase family protein [Thermoproteota archaeon]